MSNRASDPKSEEIRRRQSYQSPTPDQLILYAEVQRAHMASIEAMLLLPPSRDRAVAITQLESSRMHSNKAVALASIEACRAAVERLGRD